MLSKTFGSRKEKNLETLAEEKKILKIKVPGID
jgi:hypothetical protein